MDTYVIVFTLAPVCAFFGFGFICIILHKVNLMLLPKEDKDDRRSYVQHTRSAMARKEGVQESGSTHIKQSFIDPEAQKTTLAPARKSTYGEAGTEPMLPELLTVREGGGRHYIILG